MSHNQSACIPPPSDYSSRPKPPHYSKSSERGGRGRGGRRGQCRSTSSQIDRQEGEDEKKNQPQDKFHRNDYDDYFARVLDEEVDEEASNRRSAEDDDEDDPLDAYMKSLEANEGEDLTSQTTYIDNIVEGPSVEPELCSTNVETDKKGVRLDIDVDDDIEESYYQYVEQSKGKNSVDRDLCDSDEKQNLVEYDKDGNILSVRRNKKEIDPLPAIDHSTIVYEPFNKMFYQEHDEIKRLTQEQGDELRAKLEIKVSGEKPPKPVCSFAHFRFDEQLMKIIRRSEYTQPTPIQAQAIPAALLGRNIIGIAVTGSGKTAAYLWPMIVHIMGQPDLKRGDGPVGLVLVPTRELALQVYGEARKFSNVYKIAVVCAYGGGSKYEQSRDLEAGAEIVVATPGRIIDLIKLGVTNLKRVTYLVLDEADRFFDMGFEAQVRSICDRIRPDRQTLLFSATFKRKIEHLARSVADNPVKIVQKTLGEVNEDVTQHMIVLPVGPKKWEWLTSKLVEFTSAGSVLIFVTRILNSEELHKNLKEAGHETLLLHGDMEQSERNRVITSFKRKENDILIATDVAARGLDIAHVRTVINYDVARDIDTHTHRVGRTGRAGLKGDAYTLVTEKDKDFAGHLVNNLEASNQVISEDLMKLAMQSHNFRNSRKHKHHKHHSSSGSRDGRHHSGRDGQHHRNDFSHHRKSSHSHRYHSDRDREPHPSSSNRNSSRTDYDRDNYHNDRKRSKWH